MQYRGKSTRSTAKRSKYGNRKVKIDGHTFDSMAEGNRYLELKLIERAGGLCNLRVHPKWPLLGVNGGKVADYIADFAYVEMSGGKYVRDVIEDVKGVETAVFRLKAKLFKDQYGQAITLVKPAQIKDMGAKKWAI